MPDFRVRLKVNPRTRKMVFATDVHSVFDICWYTLARKMSEDVAPEDKGPSADKKEKPEGVVMSCPFCEKHLSAGVSVLLFAGNRSAKRHGKQ